MQHDKENDNVLLTPIPIKFLPDVTKVLCKLIDPSIKEGEYYDAWNYSHHCENESYHIQGVGFDQSYIIISHADSFGENIAITTMNRLNTRILMLVNIYRIHIFPFMKESMSIHHPIICTCFKILTQCHLNQYDGPFFLQCMNLIQGTELSGQYCNMILDGVVTIPK